VSKKIFFRNADIEVCRTEDDVYFVKIIEKGTGIIIYNLDEGMFYDFCDARKTLSLKKAMKVAERNNAKS